MIQHTSTIVHQCSVVSVLYKDLFLNAGLVLQTEFSVECCCWIAGENYTIKDQETTVPLLYSVWYHTADVGQVLIYQGCKHNAKLYEEREK